MSEAQDRKTPASSQQKSPQPAEREVPIDTGLLSDAVIELNISRKNVSIYPPGHIQITMSLDRAYEVLIKLFEIRQEMTLGVAKDTLFVGQVLAASAETDLKRFDLLLKSNSGTEKQRDDAAARPRPS